MVNDIQVVGHHSRNILNGSWELVGMDTLLPHGDSRVDIEPGRRGTH